jgi:hypothetical protein
VGEVGRVGHVGRVGQVGRVGWISLASLVLLAAVWFDLSPRLRGPAPYPPEWRWDFHQLATGDRAGPALLAFGGLLTLIAVSGNRHALASPRHWRTALLVAGAALGFAFQTATVALQPDGVTRTWIARTTDGVINSYFTMAVQTADMPAAALIAHYDAEMQQRGTSAMHAVTHPPGPVLFYRTLIALFEDRETAALAGAIILGALGVLACVPLAASVEMLTGDPLLAARVGILWTLCPALFHFSPYPDQALAGLITAALALLLAAGRSVTGRRLVFTLAASACLAIALFLSYGSFAYAAVAMLVVIAVEWPLRRPARTVALVLAATACTALLIAAARAWNFNYLASARMALGIHRLEYTAPRQYSTWLWANLMDATLFAGAPVILLGVWGCIARATSKGWSSDASVRARFAVLAGILLLDASGTTRGEVGRIWVPMMPMMYFGLMPDASDRPASTVAESLIVATLLATFTLAFALRWGA